ncbi:uncharacterized protein NECHADRAFT_78373 [Fusarium vanettenii 77-13-4]|uniref:G protein-coupled receptor n=1 Tax=Fusarium vanettenii (strain ATCC MYA-4622 / CBS 123669 / FGSC 9596 / NRRL 45880 / 77-13-4) TaxID=660122 RepID=C7ZF80_FUSV7|nr:uncharacterized protein NECHADRAFT_78373 [Fusarium vanettenii 77-13-4]EEU37175.1 predicted protein [Fusarium vanettenii 77-13-4]
MTLLLVIKLILQCTHKARQYHGYGTTLYRHLQVATGLLAMFCFLDMVEYATLLPQIKPAAADSLVVNRFQLYIAGPAKAFYCLADGPIFIILVRVGLSLGGSQNQHGTPYRKSARILSLAVPFMLLVPVLTHIGYVCDFVSSMGRPYNDVSPGHLLFTAIRVDIACSVLVLSLSCIVLIHTASMAFTLHGFSANKFSSGQTLYIRCSVLWVLQAIFYTTFTCICYAYYGIKPLSSNDECLMEIELMDSEEIPLCVLSQLPGSYFYFFSVILVAGSKYLILRLLLKRSDVDELVEFFVDEDVELDTVSIASSEYS